MKTLKQIHDEIVDTFNATGKNGLDDIDMPAFTELATELIGMIGESAATATMRGQFDPNVAELAFLVSIFADGFMLGRAYAQLPKA